MRFDEQGHAVVSPEEAEQALLQSRRLLINSVLIPSTPIIFAHRKDYDRFVEWLSDELRIHPRNFAVRGSTLLGFSMAPIREKVWSSYTPSSDVDLAIIDTDYYHVIDREVRHFETRPLSAEQTAGDTDQKRKNRRRDRKFYCYKYFDLPDLPAVEQQRIALGNVPAYLLDTARTIQAFVFRDWWSLFDRWDFELRTLEDGIRQGRLSHGGQSPR